MDFWRQNGLVSQRDLNRHPFTLIGAGSIGSTAAVALTMMGVRDLTVYDPDVVEEHNLPNQMYRQKDIGRPKVEALVEVCEDFAGVTIKAVQSEFPLPSKPQGIVISGVDSMSARHSIWHQAIKFNPRVVWYVEGRMGAQEGRIYTVTPLDPHYERSLYSDEDATEELCSAKSIGFNVFFLAGLLGSQVRKLVTGELTEPEIIFDLVSNTLVTPRN